MPDTNEHDTDTPAADTPRPNTVTIRGEKGTSKARKLARTALSPEFGAMMALSGMNKASGVHADVDLSALHDELMTATRDQSATGTDRLMAQAMVLDRLFTHLTATAMRQKYVSQIAPALTLALKAQAQCRATLQAVSDIRHPRTQFVREQHVGTQFNANGHQQVNVEGDARTASTRESAERTVRGHSE